MMEAIEKLRSMRGNMRTYEDLVYECCDIADEIERELSERYMELPVDADGVPIHVGDEMEHLTSGRKFNVGRIKIGKKSVLVGEAPYDYIPNQCRHAKHDPVKELLTLFLTSCGDDDPHHYDEQIDEYAAKLREAMGGEAE